MQRRYFLQAAVMSAFAPRLSTASRVTKAPASQTYMIAKTDTLGKHQIAKMSASGYVLFTLDMPSRRHSFAINYKQQQILSIGRRPSTDIVVTDLSGNEHNIITAKVGRHFYGHGVFCRNEQYLYTTENDYDLAKGVIGVRDADDNYRLIHEFPSYGIGPHAIALSKDGKQLFVANGGVSTHPASGRKKLNIETMQSCLAVINQSSGKLLKCVTLPNQQRHNSIRHLANNDNDHIVIALQNQLSSKSNEVLLASYNKQIGQLKAIKIPQSVSQKLNGYVGDIVYDQSQHYFAASAPRGNRVLIYRACGEFVSDIEVIDACGLNATQHIEEFIVASGTGKVLLIAKSNGWKPQELIMHTNSHWDNHLLRL